MKNYDLIIIGGGPAGLRAAHRARQLGASVALVERNKLGGTAINDGVAPTRTLARAAKHLRELRSHYADYGIHVNGVSVDFPTLMRKSQKVVADLHTNHDYVGALKKAGVDVYAGVGEAKFTGQNEIEFANGTRIQGRKFILCVGGRARKVDFPGVEYTINHHDLWSLKALPKSLVVVGGANTGCQVASIAAEFGVRVTLLDMAPRLVAVEDEQISQHVQRIYEERGIDVVTGIGGIDRLEKTPTGLKFYYKTSTGVQCVDTEAVFVAAGWPGNTDTLGLNAVGVEVERSYVKVNDYLQSTAPNIYAAGDVSGRIMLTQCAKLEADIAVENALNGNARKYEPLVVSHGSFTYPEYAGVGLTESQARAKYDCAVAVVNFDRLDRAVIDSNTDGFFKLIVDKKTHRILGGHASGEQATDIVQIVAASMQSSETVDQLAALELAYPTYTSVVAKAASFISHQFGIQTTQVDELYHPAQTNASSKETVHV